MGFRTQRYGQENNSLTSEFPLHSRSFFLSLTFNVLYSDGRALLLSLCKTVKSLKQELCLTVKGRVLERKE